MSTLLVVKVHLDVPFGLQILINGLELKLRHGLERQILEDVKAHSLAVHLLRVIQLDYFQRLFQVAGLHQYALHPVWRAIRTLIRNGRKWKKV